MRLSFCLIGLLFLGFVAAAQNTGDHEEFAYVRQQIKSSRSFMPRDGYVPNKETAIAIAYAVAVPVYGKETIEAEKPLRAELAEGKWIVLGTLQKVTAGGTLIVQIDQKSGKICYLNHSM